MSILVLDLILDMSLNWADSKSYIYQCAVTASNSAYV